VPHAFFTPLIYHLPRTLSAAADREELMKTGVNKSEFPSQYGVLNLDIGGFSAIEPHFSELESRPIHSAEALEQWLGDRSALDALLDEEYSVRYVAMTCNTADAAIEKSYLGFVEDVQPQMKAWADRLDRKFLATERRRSLPPVRYEVLNRQIENRAAIFREENIPLSTEDEKLGQQYQKIVGGMSVMHDGREQTLEQMARLLESPDRKLREEVWNKTGDRWDADREAIEEIYDQMVRVRHRMAQNAGFKDYREFAFRELERFDYTPADCVAFSDAIAAIAVPAAQRLADVRRKNIGVETLRPWDMSVDALNRQPLQPFEDTQKLIDGCHRIFAKVDPAFATQFQRMRDDELLDLGSRPNKAPGGYMMVFEGRRMPFIFMNAVGAQNDVQTMLHEGGHAFHAFAVRDEALHDLRQPPIEFAEVASMGMELLAAPYLSEFYGESDAQRAREDEMEKVIRFFPWMAMIDMFQHWVYSHPDHTRQERQEAWMDLQKRFNPFVDLRGHEDTMATSWHRKGHPFTVPFYYVEYGIAQLGALGVHFNACRDYSAAVANYRRALALGGRRPLPELFSTAGVKFDFTAPAIKPLISQAEQSLS
jgi:oligoendopeptidase F